MGAIICDFGKTIDGLHMYRINGDKKEIEKYIEELKHLGCELYDETELERTWKQYSVLLKIKFPHKLEIEMEKKKAEEDQKRKEQDAIRDRIRSKKG
jgi:uncharacterized protein YifE (UPF0438 family)